MSDTAIAGVLAAYVREVRLEQNKTQQDLATEAGLTRKTVSDFESGHKNITLLTLVQLLRALDVLAVLNAFQTESQVSPLVLAKLEKEKRQRAGRSKKTDLKKRSDW
ncbi:MAG TPA: transcriptional regulator [Bacteroidetes bacterium]|nr:transcriptional regulator [Bacteroidota bacterium]